MQSDAARARVIVRGRVQGVFFRAETRDMARRMELAGSVRNRPDGAVEAAFEGRREDVERAIDWCGEGPPSARVDSVDVSWETPQGESAFEIRYR
ncbi:MAG TPA: acylphosphatase [Candidatus Anoxymicrobiaceae bacterium]|jgi:acylphosphatase